MDSNEGSMAEAERKALLKVLFDKIQSNARAGTKPISNRALKRHVQDHLPNLLVSSSCLRSYIVKARASVEAVMSEEKARKRQRLLAEKQEMIAKRNKIEQGDLEMGSAAPRVEPTAPIDGISFLDFAPEKYNDSLIERSNELVAQFRSFDNPFTAMSPSCKVEVLRSQPHHYRMRVGLGIFDDRECQYYRSIPPPLPSALVSDATVKGLRYVYWQPKTEADAAEPSQTTTKQVMVNVGPTFPVASNLVCDLMPLVLSAVGDRFAHVMRQGLRCVRFLSTTNGECVIALVYRQRMLGDTWTATARQCLDHLNTELRKKTHFVTDMIDTQLSAEVQSLTVAQRSVVGVLGHSKGVKAVVGRDFVFEKGLRRPDGTRLVYRQAEFAFSNPNASVCQATINWLYRTMQFVKEQQHKSLTILEANFNLMELYCGNANHSVALAPLFDNIFGVEINPVLIEAAKQNCENNSITNVRVVQGDCRRFCDFIHTNEQDTRDNVSTLQVACPVQVTGAEKRGRDGENATAEQIKTSVILVDPPRGGLDENSCKFLTNFSHAVYISCNPQSLLRDMKHICRTHEIARFAFLDHFPYTKHVECAVLFIRRHQ